VIPDIMTFNNAVTIPTHLRDRFIEEYSDRLQMRWHLHCIENGYGPVRVRRIREEYVDENNKFRARYIGYELVFGSSEQAIMFKLRHL
jgi:hypothetical protein